MTIEELEKQVIDIFKDCPQVDVAAVCRVDGKTASFVQGDIVSIIDLSVGGVDALVNHHLSECNDPTCPFTEEWIYTYAHTLFEQRLAELKLPTHTHVN